MSLENKVLQAGHSITGAWDSLASRKNELCVLEYCLLECEENEEQWPEQILQEANRTVHDLK